MFCTKCGKEILDDAIICVHCGCGTQANSASAVAANDAPSAGMAVLGFLFL